MNSKIALSGLSILVSLALMGGATYAFFSDSATSTGNSFASGTLNLLVDDANELTPAPSVTGTLAVTNFAPGQSTSGYISLHNPGTLPVAEVELTANTTPVDGGTDGSDMRNVLQLAVVLDDAVSDPTCTDGVNMASDIDAQVGDGVAPLTLAEFDNGTDEFDAFPGLASGATRNVCFTVTFASGATDIYQGDTASTSFVFTANQTTGQ